MRIFTNSRPRENLHEQLMNGDGSVKRHHLILLSISFVKLYSQDTKLVLGASLMGLPSFQTQAASDRTRYGCCRCMRGGVIGASPIV